MNKQITSVFYDANLLPFKDSARTIHYPLVSGTFAGSHNTKEVRFYVRDIGGTNGISWVVVSKLPNGKIGYEVCSNVQTDSELGEQYLSFDLSAYYTQVKGDLYLALRGYQGQVTFEDDDNDGVYTISGDPLIEVTGNIKLSINYSPMVNTGTQVLPTDIDRIISALSNYLEIANGIIVTSDISGETPSDYTTNQIFFEYKNDLGTFYYVKETSGVKSFAEITFDSLRAEELRVSDFILLTNNARLYYDDSKLKMTVNGHTLALSTSGVVSIDGNELSTKVYNDTRYLIKYDDNITSSTTLAQLYSIIGTSEPCLFKYTNNNVWYIGKLGGAGGSNFVFEFENPNGIDRYQGTASDSTTLGAILDNSSIYYKPYDLESVVEIERGYSGTITSALDLEKASRPNAILKQGTSYYTKVRNRGETYYTFELTTATKNSTSQFDNTKYRIEIDKNTGEWTESVWVINAYTKEGVDNIVSTLKANSFQVVASLPATGQEGIIYLVETSSGSGVYNQYIWESGAYISLGTTQIDLSGYVQKTTTIAGIDLQDNIGASELTDALVFATNSEIDALFE